MRKDDWITKLYYKQLSDKLRNNRDSGKNVSSKKKISLRKIKFKCKRLGISFKTILPC